MKTTKPIPEGYHTVTPYLAVHRVKQTIEFLKSAFNAQTLNISRMPNDGPIMNAEIRIGDSIVMLGEKPQDQKAWPNANGENGQYPRPRSLFWKNEDPIGQVGPLEDTG